MKLAHYIFVANSYHLGKTVRLNFVGSFCSTDREVSSLTESDRAEGYLTAPLRAIYPELLCKCADYEATFVEHSFGRLRSGYSCETGLLFCHWLSDELYMEECLVK